MSDAGLARFGVRAPTIVREPVRDSQGIPICAECGHPVPQTKGPQRVHNPDLVDRELRQLLSGRPLITFGYRCEQHVYPLVMPERVTDAEAHPMEGWVGVELAFADEIERFVPVPEREVAALEVGGESA